MNNVMELLENRMSLRKYKGKEISEEDLNLILKGAMRAPTAGNMMLYSIIVVRDKETKEKLSKTCDNQRFIANSSVILIFLADLQRWFDFYKCSGVEEFCKDNNMKFETPDEGDLMLGIEDAMIAAQNAAIAAESIGVGSCYIGDIVENYDVHRKILDFPDWAAPICMLCMGYYPDNYKRIISNRFDKKYIVFNEHYKRLTDDELKDMFADSQKKVVKENIYKAKNFGQLMYARKTGTEFSREMTRSIKEMMKKWCSH